MSPDRKGRTAGQILNFKKKNGRWVISGGKPEFATAHEGTEV